MRIGVHEAEDLERLTISPGSNSQEEGVSDPTQVLEHLSLEFNSFQLLRSI